MSFPARKLRLNKLTARKPAKNPRVKRGEDQGGSAMTLVYVVAAVLVLGFIWVVWPMFTEASALSDHELESERLARQNPEAEAINPQGDEAKKK